MRIRLTESDDVWLRHDGDLAVLVLGITAQDVEDEFRFRMPNHSDALRRWACRLESIAQGLRDEAELS